MNLEHLCPKRIAACQKDKNLWWSKLEHSPGKKSQGSKLEQFEQQNKYVVFTKSKYPQAHTGLIHNLISKTKVKIACAQLFATPLTIQSMDSPGQNTGVGSLSLLQGGSSQPRAPTL